ncbi:MAG: DUF4288 domain-containing protein [Thiothrix sp.]|nr:MAG: DUF4288 domain-containing protein [Thiothrix sp.]
MSISRSEWPWYVAEYLITELLQDQEVSYSIHSYLLKADSAEYAYTKAINLGERLNDSINNEEGELVEYRCKGLFNLDTLQVTELGDETQLSVIPLSASSRLSVRTKSELSLFSE